MNDSDDKKVVLPEGDYADFLATKAGEIADEKIRNREHKWRAFQGVVITGLAILGFANIATIEEDVLASVQKDIKTDLPDQVEAYVKSNKDKLLSESFERVKQDVSARIAFMQLYNIALELEENTRVSREQIDSAISLFEQVAVHKDIVNSAEFAEPLEKIIDAFLALDSNQEIDHLESLFSERIAKSRGITMSMVQHYGLRVTGAAEVVPTEQAIFNRYALILADTHNFPELVAPYQLAIDAKANDSSKTEYGMALLQDVKHYTTAEKGEFVRIMETMMFGEFFKIATGKTERVQSAFDRAYRTYSVEIESLRDSLHVSAR